MPGALEEVEEHEGSQEVASAEEARQHCQSIDDVEPGVGQVKVVQEPARIHKRRAELPHQEQSSCKRSTQCALQTF